MNINSVYFAILAQNLLGTNLLLHISHALLPTHSAVNMH